MDEEAELRRLEAGGGGGFDGSDGFEGSDDDDEMARAIALSMQEAQAAAAAAATGWSCARCTLENDADATHCAVCDAPRGPPPPRAEPPRATPPPRKRPAPPPTAGSAQAPVLLDDDDDDDVVVVGAAAGAAAPPHKRRRPAPGAAPSAAAAASPSPPAADARYVVLVDERERQRNTNPLGIYLKLHKALEDSAPVLSPPCEAVRQSLKLGDFAFCVEKDGERRALPVLVERKKISDLVARSGAGDHMEQLRRMAAVPHAFLLLEGELWTATGYTAYGTGAGAPAAALDEAVQDEADVLKLCCELIVDERLNAKPLLCRDPLETTTLLTQLTPLLARTLTDARRPRFDDAEEGWAKRHADAARGELEEALLKGGLPQHTLDRVARSFGSVDGLRRAYGRCVDTEAKRRLCCPLVADGDGGGRDGCAERGGERDCCRVSTLALSAVDAGAGGDDGCVDLTGDSARRTLHVVLGSLADRRDGLSAAQLGSTIVRTSADASQPPGDWLQVYAAQGSRLSALHTIHLIDVSDVVSCLRAALAELTAERRDALRSASSSNERLRSHPVLLDAAVRAADLLDKAQPEPTEPVAAARQRRYSKLLVVLHEHRLRTGRRGALPRADAPDAGESLLGRVGLSLGRAALNALLLKTPWYVMPANSEKDALKIIQACCRACDEKALLGLKRARPS